jgi:3-hydroxybutyryl-CoA dehydratase
MKTPYMPNRIPRASSVGERASFSRTLTEADVALFIGVTWDVNPLHTDDRYVSETPFQRRIVPGLLIASLLTHLGGLWAFLAQEMKFKFLAPVYIGETITAEAVVVEADSEKNWVKLQCRCVNGEGKEVLHAEIEGHPGRFEVS